MIRRPPTIIALEEQDVESHLQRIYLRHTLTVDFEQMHLDEDESDDLRMDQYTMGSRVASDLSDVEIDPTSPNHEGASCLGQSSAPTDKRGASTHATPQSRSVTKSCLKSPIPRKHRSSLQKTALPRVHLRRVDRSVDPPQLKVKFALPPQDELHNGKVDRPPEETGRDRRGENDRIINIDTDTPMTTDSPLTPQVSFLSCGVSSSPAAASVPLRDLTLACTVSYEAVLAEGTASPARVNNMHLSGEHGSNTKMIT